MREEISAGGVVVFGNAILLLKKYNGDWVLPKGKVESEETFEQTAIREVFEESSVRVKVISYLGKFIILIKALENRVLSKTVHWFLM